MTTWAKHAVLYQIYLRSFYDSDGDGIGDLKGIVAKLDYLSDQLGVDAIWITPFYPSPMLDFGYDITDYQDVDPLFGSLNDFKELVKEAHARGLKVVIDFVPNHTSDRHPWFQEAKTSRDNPKRDWYVWHDGQPDTPPNNWESVFGGSAWTWDEMTQQYYLHSFLKEQPDLNWDNPEVRVAMQEQLRFWLELGVDGVRVDAVAWLSKDPLFRDAPLREGEDYAHKNLGLDRFRAINNQYGPRLYKDVQCLADVLAQYDERFMLTEAYPETWNDAAAYVQFYKAVNPRVSAPFNFEPLISPWDADLFKRNIDTFQAMLEPDDIPVYCTGNHDKPRMASRIGAESVRTAAMLLLTLPGMLVMYYGEELGLLNGDLSADDIQDPFEKGVPGRGLGRDPSRLPLPWDEGPQRGFSSGKPWLPVYVQPGISVAVQLEAYDSTLNFYRQLLALRRKTPALLEGEYRPLDTPAGVFGFQRVQGDEVLGIVLNFTDRTIPLALSGTTVFSTHGPEATSVQLWPHEGQIIALA